MAGKRLLENQPDAIRSACRLPVYEAAIAILKLPDKEMRKAKLAEHPEMIRPYIEREAVRVWEMRFGSKLSTGVSV
jgi:hypothetical protein